MAYRTEKRGKVTVAGYGPGWLEGHRLEASSREGYKSRLNHVIRELGTRTLAELEPADIRAFLRKLERSRLSSGTVRHIRTTLNEMLKCAVIDGLIDRNPCDGNQDQARVQPGDDDRHSCAGEDDPRSYRPGIQAAGRGDVRQRDAVLGTYESPAAGHRVQRDHRRDQGRS
jgi:hypothetical protein